MTDQEIRNGRRSQHNLYDSNGKQIGAMFTKDWGRRIVEGYNAGVTAQAEAAGKPPEEEA